MLVHDANSRRGSARGLRALGRRLRSFARRHRRLTGAALVGLAFVAGALGHRQGVLSAVRAEVGLDDGFLARAGALVRSPGAAMESYLRSAALPTLHIDMAFQHYGTVEAKRREALERGILFASDDDFVPARIRLGDGSVRVRMRLKGDLLDHLQGEKWSFRIHVRDGEALFGMRRFSIQHPGTRNYLGEWAWLENLRRDGVLAPRYFFVNVVFNGTSRGIFAVEEFFDKELLESQGRRDGVIVAFDESEYWRHRDQLGFEPFWRDLLHLGGFRNALFDTRRSGRVAGDSLLSGQRDEAIALLRGFQEGALPASEAFDARLLGRFLAISEIWEARHGLIWNNVDFHFNPLTGRLEPIGHNGNPQEVLDVTLYALARPWTRSALKDPAVAEAYVEELARVSRPAYLDSLRAEMGETANVLGAALFREFPAVRSQDLWDAVARKQGYIRRYFLGMRRALAYAEPGDGGDALHVSVRNVLSLPVEVLGLRLDGSFVPASETWTGSTGRLWSGDGIPSVVLDGRPKFDHEDPIRYAEFRLPLVATAPRGSPRTAAATSDRIPDLKVLVRVLGSPRTDTASVLFLPGPARAGPVPAVATLEEALRRHPFLARGESTRELTVRPGMWDVDGDLVLPAGARLSAGPGTTLRFAPGAALVARGPVDFRGAPGAPVVLAPRDGLWGGLVVLEAGEWSVLEEVEVRGTGGIQRGGWVLTGGITFYESPVRLVRARILDSQAEDAINVVRTRFEFRESEFRGHASDAFDGDFAEGTVERCHFQDVAGDAIDVSGSTVQVREVVLLEIGDKGISAGEASRVVAEDFTIVNAGIGVASKDLSRVELYRGSIEGAVHAGLAAYVKKAEYGPAELIAEAVELRRTDRRTLVRTGSFIRINGRVVEGTDVDVRALYEAGILGN